MRNRLDLSDYLEWLRCVSIGSELGFCSDSLRCRNSFLHVRRGAGQGPNATDLLYPQDGILFYEAVYGYSAALYISMLARYGYPDHAVSYLDSMLAMIKPDGLFTLNFGLPDHGALLLAISDYVLTSHDVVWLTSKATVINRMVSWIRNERVASMANQTKGSPIYGLIFYRPYCDHPAPTYSYLSDTYLVLGLEAIARALHAAPDAAWRSQLDPSVVWKEAAAYRKDVEASMKASVVSTPTGLRTVPIFPSTSELIKAGNDTARNYYVLTGSNLLEADFFNRDSTEGNLIWQFIEGEL